MERSELKVYRFVLPSEVSCVDGLREEFQLFLTELEIPPAAIDFWLLSLSELAVNAIEHGNANDASKTFEVCWSADERAVTLEIEDRGSGPPDSLIDFPDLPDDPLSEGGRGLFLIKQFADRWEHWKSRGGYRTRVVKEHPELAASAGLDPVLEQALNELSTSYESLAAFYRLGDGLVRAEKITSFISQAFEDLAKVTYHDDVRLVFSEPFQDGLHQELVAHPLVHDSRLTPLQAAVVENKEEFVWETPDEIADDPDFAGFASGLIYPIQTGGKVRGVLCAARRLEGRYFNAGELNMIRTFADLVGIAVVSANNTLARSREARALRELEIASEMQDNLLPMPAINKGDGWRLFARRKGAREVAGDHVEVAIDDAGNIYLVCIDVMGKGVSAAFLAAIFRTAFHLCIGFKQTLVELTQRLNAVLIDQMGGLTMFATCAIARVNADRSSVEIVNAGHCPVAILNDGEDLVEVEPSGPPLGLFEGIDYALEVHPLSNQSRILMVTDGLYEWEVGGDIWGWEPLMKLFQDGRFIDGEAFWNALQWIIRKEADDPHSSSDDQTILFWETV